MTGCIKCHGPTDHLGNCYICDAPETVEINKEDAQEAKDFAIVMGYDAMRICMGLEPKHNTLEDIVRWMKKISHAKAV